MTYRCLNCGHTSRDTRISADICKEASCGFRTGRWQSDDEPGYSGRPSSPIRMAGWWIAVAVGIVTIVVGAVSDTGMLIGAGYMIASLAIICGIGAGLMMALEDGKAGEGIGHALVIFLGGGLALSVLVSWMAGSP